MNIIERKVFESRLNILYKNIVDTSISSIENIQSLISIIKQGQEKSFTTKIQERKSFQVHPTNEKENFFNKKTPTNIAALSDLIMSSDT